MFVAGHLLIVTEYRRITDNLTEAHRLIAISDDLVNTHYLVVLNVQDAERQVRYDAAVGRAKDTLAHLDATIQSKESRIAYRGAKNILLGIMRDCEKSIGLVRQGNIQQIGDYYAETHRKNDFLKTNVAKLILAEIDYVRLLESRIRRAHQIGIFAGLALFGTMTAGCVVFAFIFSARLTAPLLKLTRLASHVAQGNLKIEPGGDLLDRQDEIGKLSRSFGIMIVNLMDAIQRLEESNKDLDDFTHIVSHDLKEPLRGIDSFSKFVVEDYGQILPPEGNEYLRRIRDNVTRMRALIDDLLKVSKLNRPNAAERVPLGELLRDVRQRLGHLLDSGKVELVVPENLPELVCDSVRLKEVFANFISNAVKYNDKDRCRIEIQYRVTEGKHEFRVVDNGPGIAPEYHERIFQIFQRLPGSSGKEGTGVGLAIVKRIIEGHGGRVWVESEPGKGTAMVFTIKGGAMSNTRGGL